MEAFPRFMEPAPILVSACLVEYAGKKFAVEVNHDNGLNSRRMHDVGSEKRHPPSPRSHPLLDGCVGIFHSKCVMNRFFIGSRVCFLCKGVLAREG
jgi:hypothetical protein